MLQTSSATVVGHVAVVIPTHNRRHLAEPCLLAARAAVSQDGDATLVVVDQNSRDGVREFAESLSGVIVVSSSAGTVSALRNEGVARSVGRWVCFIDSDVLVPPNYLALVRRALADAPNAIVGRAYALPERPHWLERAWDSLSTREGDGERTYLNAGNIALSRELFEALGGFDPTFSSGEDTDLARRARRHGVRCIQFDDLRAVHLGNPKSISDFFKKQRWHGEGATLSDLVARAAIATAVADVGSLIASTAFVLVGQTWIPVLFTAIFVPSTVPTLAYAHRAWSRRRLPPFFASVFLLHVYFLARFAALATRAVRRTARS